MGKKMMTVFLICVLLVNILQFSTADKTTAEMEAKMKSLFSDFGTVKEKLKTCIETCNKGCKGNNKCHSDCETNCGKKEVADKFNIKFPK
ncbi:hypothetical protein SDJN03_15819, partial [Cucurbita argyrosperma subsp. sororia]